MWTCVSNVIKYLYIHNIPKTYTHWNACNININKKAYGSIDFNIGCSGHMIIWLKLWWIVWLFIISKGLHMFLLVCLLLFAAPLDSSKKCALNQTACLETPPTEITSIIYISMILYICITMVPFPWAKSKAGIKTSLRWCLQKILQVQVGWGGKTISGIVKLSTSGGQTFKHTVILRDFTYNNILSGLII